MVVVVAIVIVIVKTGRIEANSGASAGAPARACFWPEGMIGVARWVEE
jgi:hypothetical protein